MVVHVVIKQVLLVLVVCFVVVMDTEEILGVIWRRFCGFLDSSGGSNPNSNRLGGSRDHCGGLRGQ